MTEHFKTQRYEDRESSKLGVGDYFAKHVVWLFLPAIGYAAGLGLRKLTNLPWLNAASNPLGIFMGKAERAAFQHMAEQGKVFAVRRGEAIGAGLGGAYGTFRLWRTNTQQQLEVDTIKTNVEALRGMESGNQYLERENEQLRQQIRFTEQHAPAGASHADKVAASQEAAAAEVER